MKTLIVYDSMYGNTEKIANAIGGAITGEVKVLRAGDVNPSELEKPELLIVGSPTQGGRPTRMMQDFLSRVSGSVIRGINVAAFDTRFSSRWVRVFGYAARRITRSLEKLGGIPVVPPEGFFVEGTKGPLREGELERAAIWAKRITEGNRTVS
jgi:flavodoxin